HFRLSEFTTSTTALARGIDNTPNKYELANLRRLADTLEEVRELLGHPMRITSGGRVAALNAAVGGSPSSDHCRWLAADFVCPGYGSVGAVCAAINASDIRFDQLIWEQTPHTQWIHFGLGARMRQQTLSWSPATRFVPGLVALVK